MKIFIGENRSCGLNYQHDLIFNELSFKYEITDDSKDYLKMLNSIRCYNLIYQTQVKEIKMRHIEK